MLKSPLQKQLVVRQLIKNFLLNKLSMGGDIAVGWTKSYGAGDWDIYLVKTNVNGAIEWTKTYRGSGEEVDCFVHQCADSGYIITARTNSFGVSSADVYLIKTSIDDAMQWTTSVGGSNKFINERSKNSTTRNPPTNINA